MAEYEINFKVNKKNGNICESVYSRCATPADLDTARAQINNYFLSKIEEMKAQEKGGANNDR